MTSDKTPPEPIKLYLYAAESETIVVMRRGSSEGIVGDMAGAVTPGRSFLGVPYDVYRQHLEQGTITVDSDGAVVE